MSAAQDPPDPGSHPPADPGSFAARLKQRHGEGIDPEVSLDAAPGSPGPSDAGATSELVKRLASHAPGSSRYVLEGELARGAMGAILRIWDADLRRRLAMKVILGHGEAGAGAEGDGGARTPRVEPHRLSRFLEEAQVTGQLDHPGIVPVHELGLDQDGRVYFTMKLVKGRDLKTIFDLVFQEKEGWNETRALSVILRACEALAYAHKKGVIHRDLKPANVMVGSFGEVYVMDWGLARVLGRKDTHDIRIAPEFASSLTSVKTERREEREELTDSPIVTMDGDVVGTPAYMPPEQARGEVDKLGPRGDVYAIGAILYHLLARQPPYLTRGMRASSRTVLAMVLQGPPAPLAVVRKEVPVDLVAICEKAMAREPKRRYPDTLALAEDLRAYLEHRVVGAYETGAWAEARKWVQRNKPLAASLAAAVLLLVAGLTASLVFKARSDENAAIALRRAKDLENANETISARNQELAAATKTAQENESLAKESEGRALASEARAVAGEARAVEQEQVATRKANDVLSLSAIQDLKELEDRADLLWPAHPENLTAYEAWLSDARVLIEGGAADPEKGVKKRPSLAEHEAKLLEIRRRAKERTPAEVEADRRSSPSFAEWEGARAELTWMRRMLGLEPWPGEAEALADLSKENLPADANALNALAWPLVDTDPAKVAYGGEVRALVLARRAVAAAKESERPAFRDTLAWALYRTGRFDESRTEEERAVAEVDAGKKKEYEGYLESLGRAIARWSSEEARSKRSEEASKLAARVAELERDVDERRTFEFGDGEDRWWHAQLARLVSDLKAFADEKAGGLYSSGTSEKHGWGIVKRAEFARTIEERSVSGPEAKKRWDEAIAAVAKSPKYGGLLLAPQIGLLPIGEDPDSHLWEFAHLQTGEVAQRGADGKLVLDERMGLVFVLIPGGTFWMGAQKADEHGHDYDPQARWDESPVHEVELSPYFLSKYEMTQGQWERITGRNPSYFGPSSYGKDWNRKGKGWSALHPVEQVSWIDCASLMDRLGLSLPTEAQWECGCRAATESVYWSGDGKETLVDAGNVADAYANGHGGGGWSVIHEAWDDGNTCHAEIGTYRANALGLHDVHGNVWEWCLDGWGSGFYGRSPRTDPVAPWQGSAHRVSRGGSFDDAASDARSAARSAGTPENRRSDLGVRPARASRLSPSPLHH